MALGSSDSTAAVAAVDGPVAVVVVVGAIPEAAAVTGEMPVYKGGMVARQVAVGGTAVARQVAVDGTVAQPAVVVAVEVHRCPPDRAQAAA